MAADISNFTSWSTTASSNQPDASDSISNLDENLQQIQSEVRKYVGTKGADIASGATVDLSTATGNYVHITGVTTITALGTVAAGIRMLLVFDGILTFTHNGTSLILPGAANITTAAGDRCEVVSLGSGNWRCLWYQKASGAPVGGALVPSNNLSDVASASTSRTNLGLGTSATVNTGTASGNVPLVGSESATTTVAGLVRKSTTAENAAGTGSGVVAAADLPTAVAALAPSGIGVSQTWQDKTSVRAATTVYQNTTGKPIMVNVSVGAVSASGSGELRVDTVNPPLVNVSSTGTTASYVASTLSAVVPNNHYYQLVLAGTGSKGTWAELTA